MTGRRTTIAEFRERARQHQAAWMRATCNLPPMQYAHVLLPPLDAEAGRNFIDHPVVLNAVSGRFPSSSARRASSALYRNVLRSGHVPFNLFGPLIPLMGRPALAEFWSSLLALPIRHVSALRFEHAPDEAHAYLADGTKFDAYLETALDDGRRLDIGIEVKYSEGSYSWGRREKRRMHASGSRYRTLSQSSGLYGPVAWRDLATVHLKQMWRNQLLGAAVRSRVPGVADFVYVHLFPAGNRYQGQNAARYSGLLTRPAGQRAFRAITYEIYLEAARPLSFALGSIDWVEYCQRRYLF